MSSSDPIISLFIIVLRRVLIFAVLSVLLGLLIWYWLLTSKFDVDASGLLIWVRVAWHPIGSKVPAVFLYGALTIGTLTTTVIYLLIGRWWKKRANVTQHRGARLDNQEV